MTDIITSQQGLSAALRNAVGESLDTFFTSVTSVTTTPPDPNAVRLCRLMADHTLTAMDMVMGKAVVPDTPEIHTFVETIDSFIDTQRQEMDEAHFAVDLRDPADDLSDTQQQELAQFVDAQERRALQIDALELFAAMVLFQMCALQGRPE